MNRLCTIVYAHFDVYVYVNVEEGYMRIGMAMVWVCNRKIFTGP